MTDAVRLTHDGPVALLQMTQPESRNAFSDAMKDGLRDAVHAVSGSDQTRA